MRHSFAQKQKYPLSPLCLPRVIEIDEKCQFSLFFFSKLIIKFPAPESGATFRNTALEYFDAEFNYWGWMNDGSPGSQFSSDFCANFKLIFGVSMNITNNIASVTFLKGISQIPMPFRFQ